MEKVRKNKKAPYILVLILVLIFIIVTFNFIKRDKQRNSTDVSNENKKNANIENIENNVSEKQVYKKVNVSLPIFMYHFILDDYGDNLDIENFVKPSTLEKQLKYIKENGYQTVFVNEIENLSSYTKPVAHTFDDCFVYFYNNAFPLL